MLKCEICYDWCSRVKTTVQWWDLVKSDWKALNGKDLPYYIAILNVLRETTKEMCDGDFCQNHSTIDSDREGYQLLINKTCEFVPLTESEKKSQWRGLLLTIRAFRNSSAHITHVQAMNPFLSSKDMDQNDSTQDFYRYAPFPNLYHDSNQARSFSDSDLIKMHEFIKPTILCDVRSTTSNIPSHRIKYEFHHVERGPFVDLLNENMIDLLKEVKVW